MEEKELFLTSGLEKSHRYKTETLISIKNMFFYTEHDWKISVRQLYFVFYVDKK